MKKIDRSLPVKFADDCIACPDCGEPFCVECNEHYADCKHPGPMSEDDEDDDDSDDPA